MKFEEPETSSDLFEITACCETAAKATDLNKNLSFIFHPLDLPEKQINVTIEASESLTQDTSYANSILCGSFSEKPILETCLNNGKVDLKDEASVQFLACQLVKKLCSNKITC